MTDFDKLARGFGMWRDIPSPEPAPAEGQAARPPQLQPPPVQAKPGHPARSSGPGNRK